MGEVSYAPYRQILDIAVAVFAAAVACIPVVKLLHGFVELGTTVPVIVDSVVEIL